MGSVGGKEVDRARRGTVFPQLSERAALRQKQNTREDASGPHFHCRTHDQRWYLRFETLGG